MNWREYAEYVTSGDARILGEDDGGGLYIPSRTVAGFWDRPFNRLNPLHWPYYLRSRLTGRIAFLEQE